MKVMLPKIPPFVGHFIVFIIGLIVAGIVASQIANSINITFNTPEGYILGMANACITINSIALATILAVIAIIASVKQTMKASRQYLVLSLIPIIGIGCALFSLNYSYFDSTFDMAKELLAASIEISIASIFVVYLLLAKLSLPPVGSED